jgi:predicted transposase/invertase (TIGR01784 family)
MSEQLLSFKNDYVFKRIFGDPANADALIDFLKSVLTLSDDEYGRLETADPHLQRHTEEDKLGILDLKLHTATGKIIHLEIQIANEAGFRERAVYYGARLLTDQVNRGDAYGEMRRVISILITDFPLITENDFYRNRYYLHDPNTGSTFSGILEINTLELSKLPAESDDSELWNWLMFMKARSEKEMAELAKKNPNIGKVRMVLREMSEDETERALADAEQKERWAMLGRLKYAEQQGEIRGEKRGEQNNRLRTAIKLKQRGMDIAEIADITGLSPEETASL